MSQRATRFSLSEGKLCEDFTAVTEHFSGKGAGYPRLSKPIQQEPNVYKLYPYHQHKTTFMD